MQYIGHSGVLASHQLCIETYAMCRIDWPLVLDFFTASAAFGTLAIAYIGLHTWRQQLHGTSEYQLAIDILSKTYLIQDHALGLLGGLGYTFSPDNKKTHAQWATTIKGYEEDFGELTQSLIELKMLWHQGRAYWGTRKFNAMYFPLSSSASDIKNESEILLHLKHLERLGQSQNPPVELQDEDATRLLSAKKFLLDGETESNAANQLMKAVYATEDFLAPIISKTKSTGLHFRKRPKK